MDNRESRWVAGILLLAMFGVIAYAGGRAAPKAQTTQNVLVTNTSSQPIPIAARPGTGAYIVAVSNSPTVKVLSSTTGPVVTKEVNNPDAHRAIYASSFALTQGVAGYQTAEVNLSSLPVVIDEINFTGISFVTAEYINTAAIVVFDSSNVEQGSFAFGVPALQNTNNYSEILQGVSIPVPANGGIRFEAQRFGGSSEICNVQYSIAYHTVPNP